MNEIPDEIDDLRFCVLDNSNPTDADYFFIPLIFLESFNAPAVVLKIGEHQVKMPVDWQIVVADEEFGDCEVVPLEDVNDRGFTAFVYKLLTKSLATAKLSRLRTLTTEASQRLYIMHWKVGALIIWKSKSKISIRMCVGTFQS
jgi:hypothetical protein